MSTLVESLDRYLENKDSTIARDLKLNLKRILGEGRLTPEEGALALFGLSVSVENRILGAYAKQALEQLGVSSQQIQEAAECSALMLMLNTYYRFRHFVQKEEYSQAGLRMTALAKPLLGKDRFEMLAFALSILNGCETCVRSHEQVLCSSGISSEKIHDLARLASVVRALSQLEKI